MAIIGDENPDLLGYTGIPTDKGPRFRKLTSQEINDRLEALWYYNPPHNHPSHSTYPKESQLCIYTT